MYFTENFSLAPYGEEFKDSYIIFKLMTKKQAIEFSRLMSKLADGVSDKKEDLETAANASEGIYDAMYELIANQFINGNVYDADKGKMRDMVVADVEDLPVKIASAVIEAIQSANTKKN